MESLFSYETLFSIQGDPIFGMSLHFNSLPILLSTMRHPARTNAHPHTLACTNLLYVAERAEKLAYNALPATITPDMWAHQYLQQSNEMNAVVSPDHIWTHDGPDATL